MTGVFAGERCDYFACQLAGSILRLGSRVTGAA
jgi:hypothetical protein